MNPANFDRSSKTSRYESPVKFLSVPYRTKKCFDFASKSKKVRDCVTPPGEILSKIDKQERGTSIRNSRVSMGIYVDLRQIGEIPGSYASGEFHG